MDLPAKLMSILDNIRNLQVDTTCLQEVNDSLPMHNRQKVANALSHEGKFAHLSISTVNPYQNKTTHQPGGNIITLTSQTQHNLPSISNPQNMGRWAFTSLNYPKSRVTGSGTSHIFSIYRATAVESGENVSLAQKSRKLASDDRDDSLQTAFLVSSVVCDS